MMWDRIMELVVAEIAADTVLSAIFGDHIRQAPSSGDMVIPGIEWTLIGDTENELWAPMIIQFDLWLSSAESMRQAERRLRQLYHRDVPRAIGDFQMWTTYSDGTILAVPDRANYSGRALRFQMTPLREQYAGVS